MSHLLRNILIALGITIIVGVVYAMLFKEEEAAEDAYVMTSVEKNEVVLQTEKMLADINKINEYQVDSPLFNDERFMSLEDYRVQISDVGTGRNNPFQPVE